MPPEDTPPPDDDENRPETDPTQAKWITDEFEDEYFSFLNTAEERIIKLVKGTVEKTSKTAPITSTFDKVDKVMGDAYEEAADLAEEEITKGYQQGVRFGAVQLGAPLEVRQAAWKLIGDRIVASQSEFKGHTEDTARKIKRIIADGIEQEKTQGQIIKDIQAQFEKTKSDATRIIRTETMKAVNKGVVDRYKQAGIEPSGHGRIPPFHPDCRCTAIVRRTGDEMVMVVLAAADERTCPECADLDGTVI